MDTSKILFFDGAMGTLLQAQGLDTLPEIWNATHPQAIYDIHKAYVSAGCDFIKANTFGANRLKLHASGYTPGQLIEAGIALAKKAAGCAAKVALDIGPTGKLLAPVGDLGFEEAVDIFAEMVRAGDKADFILIETMSDTYEIKAAMLAAKENSNLPIMVTFSPDASGRLLTGADVLTAATLIESLGACAIGLNCGTGPKQLQETLAELCRCVRIPVIFNPNGGLPQIVGGNTVFDLSPAEYAAQMRESIALGAAIIGGCCGTTPAHLEETIKAVRGMAPVKTEVPPRTRISSFGQTVTLGGEPIIIGERINPTGKPRLKQALRDKDMGFICKEALTQIDQGAKLLDINVGLPGIDEAQMLAKAVYAVQSITATPLVIDTADTNAAEAALRIYNGKPLLNAVSGKRQSLDKILPLAKKYGAALVALTLDDDGIPETTAGRIAIAKKIIAAAEAHGIPRADIIVDALTMTISTNSQNGTVTLDTVEYLHKKMDIRTVLGLSNISFGLPAREKLNAGFFTLATARGLSAAIANPANTALMESMYINNVLTGRDENCKAYIEYFSAQKQEKPQDTAPPTLHDAVINGLEAEAKKITEKMLHQTGAMEIINTCLIPALNHAGQTFAQGKTFLPQLLISAAAAKSAFEAIRAKMSIKGQAKKRGKIVLATVKGDIHDIGKNIVKTLLENYNFHVIDLGKNVPPEEILKTVLEEAAPLVGLSALMTTTVTAMEETIQLLRKNAPHCRIMVGGAVLTESYAKQIGADFYSPDAIGAVRYAEEVFDNAPYNEEIAFS